MPDQRASLDRRSARREKYLAVVPVSDTELRIVSTLRDTSTSVADSTEVTGHSDQQPYDQCALTLAPLGRLRGLTLAEGSPVQRRALGQHDE
jgi:hypothetical protein